MIKSQLVKSLAIYLEDQKAPFAFFTYPELCKSISDFYCSAIINDSLLPAPIAIVFGKTEISNLEKSWSTELAHTHPSGAWRTIHGVHVFVDPIHGEGAKIIAGPKHWVGRHPDEVEKEVAEHKRAAKESGNEEAFQEHMKHVKAVHTHPEAAKQIEKHEKYEKHYRKVAGVGEHVHIVKEGKSNPNIARKMGRLHSQGYYHVKTSDGRNIIYEVTGDGAHRGLGRVYIDGVLTDNKNTRNTKSLMKLISPDVPEGWNTNRVENALLSGQLKGVKSLEYITPDEAGERLGLSTPATEETKREKYRFNLAPKELQGKDHVTFEKYFEGSDIPFRISIDKNTGEVLNSAAIASLIGYKPVRTSEQLTDALRDVAISGKESTIYMKTPNGNYYAMNVKYDGKGFPIITNGIYRGKRLNEIFNRSGQLISLRPEFEFNGKKSLPFHKTNSRATYSYFGIDPDNPEHEEKKRELDRLLDNAENKMRIPKIKYMTDSTGRPLKATLEVALNPISDYQKKIIGAFTNTRKDGTQFLRFGSKESADDPSERLMRAISKRVGEKGIIANEEELRYAWHTAKIRFSVLKELERLKFNELPDGSKFNLLSDKFFVPTNARKNIIEMLGSAEFERNAHWDFEKETNEGRELRLALANRVPPRYFGFDNVKKMAEKNGISIDEQVQRLQGAVNDHAKEKGLASQDIKVIKGFKLPEDIPALNETQEEAIRLGDDLGSGLISLGTGHGKTAVAIATMLSNISKGKAHQYLIIAPTDEVAASWAKEIDKFTDGSIKYSFIGTSKNKGKAVIPEESTMTMDRIHRNLQDLEGDVPLDKVKDEYKKYLASQPKWQTEIDPNAHFVIMSSTSMHTGKIKPEHNTIAAKLAGEDKNQIKHIIEEHLKANTDKKIGVTLDEAHKIVDSGNAISHWLNRNGGFFNSRYALTATPVRNVPGDVYNLVHFVSNGHHDLGTYSDFKRKYFISTKPSEEEGAEIKGQVFAVNPDKASELGDKLASYGIMRTDSDLAENKKPSETNYNTTDIKLSDADGINLMEELLGNKMQHNSIYGISAKYGIPLDRAFQNRMAYAEKIAFDKHIRPQIVSDIKEIIKQNPDAKIAISSGNTEVQRSALDAIKEALADNDADSTVAGLKHAKQHLTNMLREKKVAYKYNPETGESEFHPLISETELPSHYGSFEQYKADRKKLTELMKRTKTPEVQAKIDTIKKRIAPGGIEFRPKITPKQEEYLSDEIKRIDRTLTQHYNKSKKVSGTDYAIFLHKGFAKERIKQLKHELSSVTGVEKERLQDRLDELKQEAKGRGRAGLSADERREWDEIESKLSQPTPERIKHIKDEIKDLERREARGIELSRTAEDPTVKVFLTSPNVIETGVQAGQFTHILFADSGGYSHAKLEQFRGRFARSSGTHPRTEFRDYNLSLAHGGETMKRNDGSEVVDDKGRQVKFISPAAYAGLLRDAKADLINDVHNSFRQGSPVPNEDIYTEHDVSGYLSPNEVKRRAELRRFYDTRDRYLQHSMNYNQLMNSTAMTPMQVELMKEYQTSDPNRQKVIFSKMNKIARQAIRTKEWRDQTERTYLAGMKKYAGKEWQRSHAEILEERKMLGKES